MTAEQMKPDPNLEGVAVLRAMAKVIWESDDMADTRARCFHVSRLSREQTISCAKALDLAANELDRLTEENTRIANEKEEAVYELAAARQTFGRLKQSMREQYDAGLKPEDNAFINAINNRWEARNNGHTLLWGWFNLSYASFLTLPRVLMHAMPDHWQGRMALLLEEFDHAFPGFPDIGFRVQAIKDKKLVKFPDWLLQYRRPDLDEIDKCRSPRPRTKLPPAAGLKEMES